VTPIAANEHQLVFEVGLSTQYGGKREGVMMILFLNK
jgi:hypothetical protein